ncbi:hypothetical protein MNBD_GAMMA23-2171 [hydrothermal vent metagenome]|uniref:DUF4124 domain-containing protein n=1 Tax=hydrothermal vent metagenome TaxID=652676 RepID=A0A3B0ZKT4_9ZZZZ
MIFKILKIICITFVLTAAFQQANAKIYKWVDEDGQTHFSHEKPAGVKGQQLAATSKVAKSLKNYLYPFGTHAKLKSTKKRVCDKNRALTSLRKRFLAYSQNSKTKEDVYLRKYKNVFKNTVDKQRYLYDIKKECQQYEAKKITEEEVYVIKSAGIKRLFGKNKIIPVRHLQIGLSRYASAGLAKIILNQHINKKFKKYSYSKKIKLKTNGFNIVLIKERGPSVAKILMKDVLIEIKLSGDDKFKNLEYFVRRYTKWLKSRKYP